MPHYRYLIIGGGMTADAAVRGIQEVESNASIGVISAETDAPYTRPLLSKALWKGEPLDAVWRNTAETGAELRLGRRATSLDAQAKRVTDDAGAVYTFDKLLLATGGAPRRFPYGGDRVTYFRTLNDYRRLRQLADEGKTFAVIGGGFIGSEIAAALAMNGRKTTLLFPEDGIGARVFPADLSRFLVDYYREKGVTVCPGVMVSGIHEDNAHVVVRTSDGASIHVDAVVAGLGIVPETGLAKDAGLGVGDGIMVDEQLRTSHPDVYAAGDVANVYAPSLGRRIRVEHEDNALTMGRAAGRAMAGDTTPYTHLPFFYSDLFDLGYEAVGELDPRGETVADWKDPFREGVIYYLSGGKVSGVLLWNTWGQVEAARKLIGTADRLS